MLIAPSKANVPLQIAGDVKPEYNRILTPEALDFVANLVEQFTPTVEQLLKRRIVIQNELKKGRKLGFLPDTKNIREGNWKVGAIPKDLQDRRVEITGPVERKMIINALNSGAKAFMADFEDSLTPGWKQVVEGQINLKDAVDGTISYKSPEGKEYKVGDRPAVLIIRPRGWHLKEKHVLVKGKPIYGAFLDFGLYFFHNAKALLAKGSGPYFYLPKLENHLEAKLWNDIFVFAQETLGLPIGTIKATVLIETITAAFEMEEILYVLKDHIVAQNAGRWDYIFSYIKKHSHEASFVCPDRAEVTMTKPFLKAYYLLLIKTCHKRGAMAMGGMAAQIPIKNDEAANAAALARVKADKEREAGDGHDGTWVAHPGLVPVAMEVFNRLMPTPNQISKLREDVQVTSDNLLEVPTGNITEAGFRNNVSVSLQYLESWLRGVGCVPIFNLMEDAATAEISRTQLWQWIHHKAKLSDGTPITEAFYKKIVAEEQKKISDMIGKDAYAKGKFAEATAQLDRLVLNSDFEEFLTLRAYDKIH
ncbi:MAG: malate synthase A [Proteobacteria bacterium]|nr:malate synthase A [Pseudomonadota bacterium]